MIAFLKRRWILLSGSVMLVACTMVELRYEQRADAMVWVCAYIGSTQVMSRITPRELRISEGTIYSRVDRDLSPNLQITSEWSLHFHRPNFGESPRWRLVDYEYGASIPLWLPLSVILGWIVIRELRCREKREKDASLQP